MTYQGGKQGNLTIGSSYGLKYSYIYLFPIKFYMSGYLLTCYDMLSVTEFVAYPIGHFM